MDNDVSYERLRYFGIGHNDAVAPVYRAAVATTDLRLLDYLTMRDLIQLSGCDEPGIHALLVCLFAAQGEGSICLPLTELSMRLPEFVAACEANDIAIPTDGAKLIEQYPALMGDNDQYSPLIVSTTASDERLYFQRYFIHERMVKAHLAERLANSAAPTASELSSYAATVKNVLEDNPAMLKGRPLQLNAGQQLATALALLQPFVIISGGPGTGKTSIVFTLLRCLMRLGMDPHRVVLAAPTGRAAQRLTDALQEGLRGLGEKASVEDHKLESIQGQTIHRALKYRRYDHRFTFNRDNPLTADFVLIDEVSMVDVVMMARLLDAVSPDTRLVFLGDRDQLPSVDAGTVLADLMPHDMQPAYTDDIMAWCQQLLPGYRPVSYPTRGKLCDRIVLLEQSYRSERRILALAKRIRGGERSAANDIRAMTAPPTPEWPVLDGGEWLLPINYQDLPMWRQQVSSWVEQHYLSHFRSRQDSYVGLVQRLQKLDLLQLCNGEDDASILDELFAYVQHTRILTIVRHGAFGCNGINNSLGEQFMADRTLAIRGQQFSGAPIVITENDYANGLFNGDCGVIICDGSQQWRAVFPRNQAYVTVAAEMLPAFDLAFATTVHKSQGSEYNHVLLVLPNDPKHRLLTREIVYTGVTRARQLVIVAGSKALLSSAIDRRIRRDSGIDVWELTSTPQPEEAEQTTVPAELAGLPLFDMLGEAE